MHYLLVKSLWVFNDSASMFRYSPNLILFASISYQYITTVLLQVVDFLACHLKRHSAVYSLQYIMRYHRQCNLASGKRLHLYPIH